MINGNIEFDYNSRKNVSENIFDPTPYNYIFNRSTSFLDGDFVQFNHLMLNEILTNLEKVNPVLLEML